ncbi:hypothetical protein PV08_09864 [Exophiala spinifera]|uniref:Uncharacterized protein n=1 Tax=Exophiala spinifera TaxID=91928 RepID=A0A0D1YCF1_9EURO|nr:uncharacterized protein PV08_09864 [Exophiala spinifera]KIW12586.1 hypothetical protein PV08_09864 [Exophiala spinifera]
MRDHESVLTRILLLVVILLTSLIAIAVLVIKDRRSTGTFYGFVTSHRDTIGLLIQVVSAVLGAGQIFAITSLINLSARVRMQTGCPVAFQQLKFLVAITSGASRALRGSLPVEWLTVALIITLTLKLPAALWAGALTPILTDVTSMEGRIPVPTYPETALSAWQGSFRRLQNGTVSMSLNCSWVVTGDKMLDGAAALVSTCPAVDLVSAILGSLARAAAGTPSAPKPHSRIDSSGWTNLGRSFGVGSSPGIVPIQGLSAHKAPMLSLDYFEYGYRTNVSCARNEASNYTISEAAYLDDLGVTSHLVGGTLPNSVSGQVEQYALSSSTHDSNFLAWSALSNYGENILAVAGTGLYTAFDKMQCKVRFDPARFAVNVNVTNSIITVKPAADDQAVQNIEPTGEFTKSIFYALEQISRISGSTVVSTLGTALEHNIRVIKARDPGLSDEASAALSLEYGVGMLLEGLLVANAQSQLYILGNSATVPLSVRFGAVKIGSEKYIYCVLATNLAMLLTIIVEVVRTRFWKGLTTFDFTDIESIARSASVGGHAIAKQYQADRDPESSGRIFVSLRRHGNQWSLIPATGGCSSQGDWELEGHKPDAYCHAAESIVGHHGDGHGSWQPYHWDGAVYRPSPGL